MKKSKTLVVIGGGAAGFFCAINASLLNPTLQVFICEKTSKYLSKVLVSGGGRCNLTHWHDSIEEMIAYYPRGKNFLKKAFYEFFVPDTVRWFESRGVRLKVEPDGRMFPVSDRSESIVQCLLDETRKAGIQLMKNFEVKRITRRGHQFLVQGNQENNILADFVCVATGGNPKPEFPPFLMDLPIHWHPTVPSLFTFNVSDKALTSLMGLSVDNTTVKIAENKFLEKGPLLITHWGLSGPVILKLSAWNAQFLASLPVPYHFSIYINWTPLKDRDGIVQEIQKSRQVLGKRIIDRTSLFGLPSRLWSYLVARAGVHSEMRWGDLPAELQNKLAEIVHHQQIQVRGKTTFKEEFVQAGGVDLREIEPLTMESRKYPGLFFAGEVLNVDGLTGGYNFQNAWTSGYLAARTISKE